MLGLLYESYIHPLTILSTLPSAGVGALLILMAGGYDLTVIALIGIILLIGIVKKNGIMMVDFALTAEREQGMKPQEAIYRACLLRFRPIMMTTMCALLSGLPLMLGHGAGLRAAPAAGLRDGRRAGPVAGADAVHHAGGLPLPRPRALLVRETQGRRAGRARPRRPARAVAPPPPAGAEASAEPRALMKLLIVEDEPKTAEYLQKGLAEQGCAVDVAHNGIDGQHLALVHDYDVIVLDAMLPGLDGFALLRALRAREADAGHHADRARLASRTACAACTTAPTTTSSSPSPSSSCWRACRRCSGAAAARSRRSCGSPTCRST